MKLLVAGDWHGNHVWAKKIIEVAHAEEIDKIIQVGDFGVWPDASGEEYLDILSRALVKRNVSLYFVPGNHEDYNQIDEWTRSLSRNEDGHIQIRPNLFYAGKVNAWTWENKRFASVGGAVSIDRSWRRQFDPNEPDKHATWWPQEKLTALEETQAKDLGKVDYLFSHDAPVDVPLSYLKKDEDSQAHRYTMTKIGRALRPKMWFHGHYHRHMEYSFYHDDGETKVIGLDADPQGSKDPQLYLHAAVLDTDINEVSYIRKHFNWWAKAFYFDRQHEMQKCYKCNQHD